jgi:orotate phosphoribosyltransferase-like protein
LSGESEARAELQSLADKASDLRKEGKAWSEVAEMLNLSPSTQSALYLVSKEFPDVFPVAA